jgi:hypothetical protein
MPGAVPGDEQTSEEGGEAGAAADGFDEDGPDHDEPASTPDEQ